MVRPERDEPLDEGSIRRDARGQRGDALLRGDFNELATQLLSLLRSLPRRTTKRADGFAERRRRARGRRRDCGCSAFKLRAQPGPWIVDAPTLTDARAQAEPVQGAKGQIHPRVSSFPHAYRPRRCCGRQIALGGLLQVALNQFGRSTNRLTEPCAPAFTAVSGCGTKVRR